MVGTNSEEAAEPLLGIPMKNTAGRRRTEHGGNTQTVRMIAGAMGCIAVLALIGMETRGLMRLGTCVLHLPRCCGADRLRVYNI
jgi:hypothetical protein